MFRFGTTLALWPRKSCIVVTVDQESRHSKIIDVVYYCSKQKQMVIGAHNPIYLCGGVKICKMFGCLFYCARVFIFWITIAQELAPPDISQTKNITKCFHKLISSSPLKIFRYTWRFCNFRVRLLTGNVTEWSNLIYLSTHPFFKVKKLISLFQITFYYSV